MGPTVPHPAFSLLASWLSGRDRPDVAQLNAVVDRLDMKPWVQRGRLSVRFEAAHGPKQKALEYEKSIQDTGRIPLRAHDWHDAFNALCWIAWPALKSEMNALHTVYGARSGAQRGRVRDTLTLLDESGVIVLSADPGLSALLAAKQWKTLFFERRNDVIRHMRFMVCGHALYDKLRAPYRSITGRALIVPTQAVMVEEDVPLTTQRAYADGMATSIVLRNFDVPPPTVAFPLCAVPGWWPGNECEDFYDDTSIFRTASGSLPTAASPPTSTGASASLASKSIDPTSASTDAHSAVAPASLSSSALP